LSGVLGKSETAKTATFEALHDEISIQEEKRRRRQERSETRQRYRIGGQVDLHGYAVKRAKESLVFGT
jgi:DNA-nicking Smr family endonuclease